MDENGKIYYSMRETTEQTQLPIATLRYWESRFDQLNPRKDGHGNRYYTADDIALIMRIKYIRDELKITRIDAIKRELNDNHKRTDERAHAAEILTRVRQQLVEIRNLL